MKSNIILILTATIAISLGLGAGYFIFDKDTSDNDALEHRDHQNMDIPSAGANNDSSPLKEEIWTCSMHPQIRQNGPGECPLCGMDLIPLESGTSNNPLVMEMTEASVQLANIQTTKIGNASGNIEKTLRLSGKVQADERSASSLVSHVPGRIEKLYVTFTGENVVPGQKLADIYSPELIVAQNELLESLKLRKLNPDLIEAARNKLRYLKISDETILSIEENGTIQEIFTLYAEKSGIVTKRRVAVGDYIKQGSPLFDLVSLKTVWVLFDAYEDDLSKISVGNRIEFTTPSVPNRVYKTRITFIDPVINPSTRVASLRTEVTNSNGLLKPEMFVNGNLNLISTNSTELIVPKTAVLWTGKRSVVYVKLPDTTIPSYEYREVIIGESVGKGYQILEGLEEGEEVVTNGNFTIDAAAQLNNQASMMNRNVSVKKNDAFVIPNFTESTPEPFKLQLQNLVVDYLSLKDGLVNTNIIEAARAARMFNSNLENVNMTLLKGEAHLYWMEQVSALSAHSKKITESNEIEEQRKQFGFLSGSLINAITAFGLESESLYVLHCPMAFNNQGGDWISSEKTIRNPFFGSKMMTCGTVKDSLGITAESNNPAF